MPSVTAVADRWTLSSFSRAVVAALSRTAILCASEFVFDEEGYEDVWFDPDSLRREAEQGA
jgi:hypothetical protein